MLSRPSLDVLPTRVPVRAPLRNPRTMMAAAATALVLAVPLAVVPSPAQAGPFTTGMGAVTAAKAYPTLSYGDRGVAVKRLQRLLGVQPVSGWFGPLTRASVKKFEKKHGMKVNGIVGGPTWRAILRVDAAKGGASRSDRSGRSCPVRGAKFSDTYGADRGSRGHAGVDMLAPRGTAVRAIESGTIVRAHWSGSNGGYTITLKGRSGSKFFYAHNDVNLVKAGESVKAGEVIAKVGSTGNAGTTNHLHFEYWKSGQESDPVNPTALVRSLCS